MIYHLYGSRHGKKERKEMKKFENKDKNTIWDWLLNLEFLKPVQCLTTILND